MSGRGYFAIGIEQPKIEKNLGVLLRSANIFGASFVFTIGARYQHQSGDTMHTPKHVPMFHFDSITQLRNTLWNNCPIIGIEKDENAIPVQSFFHPEAGCYILGAEDHGLSEETISTCDYLVQIESNRKASLNVAIAGSIIAHSRFVQVNRK